MLRRTKDRPPRTYISLDCRDGQHRACTECGGCTGCGCHTEFTTGSN